MKRIFLVRSILLFLMVFSIIYSIGALRLKFGSFTMPGPGFLPLLLGIFLTAASFISLVMSYRIKSATDGGKKEETIISLTTLKKPILMCISVIIYALVLNHLGYIISVFLLMLFLFKGVEPQGWLTALIATTLTTAVSYIIFIYWLGIQIV